MHRFRMFRRGNGWLYSEDVLIRQQVSLHTKDRKEAQVLLSVKYETYRAPMLNLMLAKTYLQKTHPEHISRTWGEISRSQKPEPASRLCQERTDRDTSDFLLRKTKGQGIFGYSRIRGRRSPKTQARLM
jgi:hypothetical protein